MIQAFLKAKHWQLFILIFGLPLIFQIVMMTAMFSNLDNTDNPDPSFMFQYMKYFPFIMVIYVGIFFGWFWSVGIGLQSKIPQNVKMKVKNFKIFFFIPLIYLFLVLAFSGIIMGKMINSGGAQDISLIIGVFAIIVPLHLFSMFCMFYILYFVAKTIKTVELQRELKFGDFAGEFFLIWFYPIGVWFIQPRINKMVGIDSNSNSEKRNGYIK